LKVVTTASFLTALAATSRGVIWVLLRVLPPRRHAVVHGWPDNEGNAIEVLRGLRRRYRGRIYWLLADIDYRGPAFAAADLEDSTRIVRLRKNSLRAMWSSLTAEVTFFTHGLYTAVNAPGNRLVVNLWHGDGPKSARHLNLVRCTVVVSATRLWGADKARIFGIPEDSLAVVGNPRSDQFAEPIGDGACRALGLDPTRRRLLWLPTFRQASGPRARSWSDGDKLSGSDDVALIVRALAQEAERLSLEFVIKPHPLDTDTYSYPGLRVLRGHDLDAAGVSLYQLIGNSDALISDISSVWVDYLALNRPIGFYIPDLDDLKIQRGLNVDNLEEILPGPRIDTPESAADFVRQVGAASPDVAPSAYPSAAEIGVVTELGGTDRLLDWLTEFQRRRGRPSLFAPSLPDLTEKTYAATEKH
jgi:CDP-glycerol glycerophosphotransferase